MKKRFLKNKSSKEVMDIDITSLLDILVILLVFLLKSYNASSLKLDLAKGIKMPGSQERKLGQHALIIQVNKNQEIWVKNKMITTLEALKPLESILKKNLENSALKAKEKNKGELVNLVFDKDLEYSNIQKVMNLCTQNKHTRFKLIVKGDFN